MPDAGENGTKRDAMAPGKPDEPVGIPAVVTYRIRFKPFAHLLSTGKQPPVSSG